MFVRGERVMDELPYRYRGDGEDAIKLYYAKPVDARLAQQQAEIDELKKKYGELLFAVSIKHPDKSRHETALRYIRQAEHQQDNAPEQQEKE
jgi:hypothetical protein